MVGGDNCMHQAMIDSLRQEADREYQRADEWRDIANAAKARATELEREVEAANRIIRALRAELDYQKARHV